jgi:hypothetical protein
MAWVLLTVTGVLTVAVAALALRVRGLERRLGALSPSSDTPASPDAVRDDAQVALDAERPAAPYVITQVGDPVVAVEPEPAPNLAAPVFADLVLKETVVQTASLFQGLRRALDPETRNRIRFHMRQEVKLSRRERRSELREVRREWAARRREAMTADEAAEPAA